MMAYSVLPGIRCFNLLRHTMRHFQHPCNIVLPMRLMCMGKERLEYYMAEIPQKGDSRHLKEQDTLKDMRIVQEMYARGFEFLTH